MAGLDRLLKLSWRIGYHNYNTPEALATLLRFLGDYPGAVDEICFFDTITHHLYPTPTWVPETAALIGRAIVASREAGIPSVGINVLCTLGHINEAWGFVTPLPFPPLVGHDGSESRGCACPNTLELRTHLREKYRLMAEQGPDFIWVDDDIRMHHHGVTYACFCPVCLGLLAEETGETWERPALVAALSDPARGDLRAAWVERNVRSLESILALVREALDEVDPAIETGLMTAGPGWTTYSGAAYDRWFGALRATKSRPGGGFYTDANLLGLYDKAVDIGWQRAGLPDTVRECVYELENFPYQTLKKSVSTVLNESAMAQAMGLNGVAYNALGMWNSPLEDKRALMTGIRRERPLWQQMVDAAPGLPTRGVWIAWTPWLMARRQVQAGEDWFADSPAHRFVAPKVLGEIGLPLATDAPGEITALYGRVAEAFSDEQLRGLLAGGVLMDVAALAVLSARGLGELAGVRVVGSYNNGVIERFTDAEWNAGLAGEARDARIEFFTQGHEAGYVLEPRGDHVWPVARLESYFGEDLGACLTAHENALGGRVVVMGYAPWFFLHSTEKRRQLQNLADWLAPRRMPVRVMEAVPVNVVARLNEDRTQGLVTFFNGGLDTLPTVTVEVRGPATAVRRLTPDGAVPLEPTATTEGWQVLLPELAPWSVTALALGDA